MSRAMRDQRARIPHLARGTSEVGDLRSDVDEAFDVREDRPVLTRITGGSTALSLAGLPTAKPLVGVGLLAGKTQASRFLVGQVMKATRGKANPQVVNGLLAERLGKMGEE